jgi:hypothetical protein
VLVPLRVPTKKVDSHVRVGPGSDAPVNQSSGRLHRLGLAGSRAGIQSHPKYLIEPDSILKAQQKQCGFHPDMYG